MSKCRSTTKVKVNNVFNAEEFLNDAALFGKHLKKFMADNKNTISFDQASNESEISDIKKIYDSSIESDNDKNRSLMKQSNIINNKNIITNNKQIKSQSIKTIKHLDSDNEDEEFDNDTEDLEKYNSIMDCDFEHELDEENTYEYESTISVSPSNKSDYETGSTENWSNTNIGSINIVFVSPFSRKNRLASNKSKKHSDDTSYNSDDEDDNEDAEMKMNRDRYIKHMDSIVEDIKGMNWGDTIIINPDPHCITNDIGSFTGIQKTCAITKIIRYSSFMFHGYGSKNILRYFMNKTQDDPEYGFQKIVQILNDKGFRRFIPIKSWDTFWKDYKDEPIKYRYLFELIRSDQPCKPYLDIEWVEKKGDPRTKDYSEFIDKLCNDLIVIFDKRYDILINMESIMISTSHSAKKVSFHVVIDKQIGKKTLAFRTNRKGCPESAWDMYIALIELDDSYEKVLDGSVYTTDREFRVLYSNKTTEFRPFVPYTNKHRKLRESAIIKKSNRGCMRYIVTYSPNNEYYHISTPDVPEKYAHMNRSYYDPTTFIPPTYTDKTINHLIQLAQKVHHTAEYTGRSSCGKGWRFSYRDKNEPCYTGEYHESNGFYIFENKETNIIYMKCMSYDCKGIKVLEGGKQTKPKSINKKLF